jgi:hypothetical protein
MVSREIDEDELLNWDGARRSHVARYQLPSRVDKYSTCDLVEVVENHHEPLDNIQLPIKKVLGGGVVIGGVRDAGDKHLLISYDQIYRLNANQRHSSKERYNNDYNRSCIGKVNSLYYDQNCFWNKMCDSGEGHTAFVVQYVGTNNYSIFDCVTRTSYICKNMTGARSLSPADIVVVELSGDILERLSHLHSGEAYGYEWRHDMEQVIRQMDLTAFEKSTKMFAWCYDSIRANKKLFHALRDVTPGEVHRTTDKQQYRRAHLGLQLLMCEVNACALVETVCPASRSFDRYLQGAVEEPSPALRPNPSRRRPGEMNTLASLSQALWMDLIEETSVGHTLPKDALSLIYSYVAITPFSRTFQKLLFQNNRHYGRVVKHVNDVGSLRGRTHLTDYCNLYASHWRHRVDNKRDRVTCSSTSSTSSSDSEVTDIMYYCDDGRHV